MLPLSSSRHTIFSPEYQAPRTTAEYDHSLAQTQDKVLMRNLARKALLMRWVSDYITEQGRDPVLVSTSSAFIVKASLNFTRKFW